MVARSVVGLRQMVKCVVVISRAVVERVDLGDLIAGGIVDVGSPAIECVNDGRDLADGITCIRSTMAERIDLGNDLPGIVEDD